MSSLETLRRQYEQLTPFERAVMASEALERLDESAIDALEPPTLWDAFHSTGDKFTFALLAFNAVYESMRGEALYWMGMAMLGGIYAKLVKEQVDGGPEYDEQADRWIDRLNEGKRSAAAWLRALAALDNEMGSACMAYARVFSGEHVKIVAAREEYATVGYAHELDVLRSFWNA